MQTRDEVEGLHNCRESERAYYLSYFIKGNIGRQLWDQAKCPLNRGCPLNWGSAQ